jgi:hypothetical protein
LNKYGYLMGFAGVVGVLASLLLYPVDFVSFPSGITRWTGLAFVVIAVLWYNLGLSRTQQDSETPSHEKVEENPTPAS